MLYDPRWPWHAAAALGAHVRAPKQYLRSQPHGLKHLFDIDTSATAELAPRAGEVRNRTPASDR